VATYALHFQDLILNTCKLEAINHIMWAINSKPIQSFPKLSRQLKILIWCLKPSKSV